MRGSSGTPRLVGWSNLNKKILTNHFKSDIIKSSKEERKKIK